MLPDCLASRLPSTLDEVERAVDRVEGHAGSLESLAVELELAGGPDEDHVVARLRWLRHRKKLVTTVLLAVAMLMPERLVGHPPTLAGFRSALGVKQVLVALRELAAKHLATLPPPLGLVPMALGEKGARRQFQQKAGTDPPLGST
jgi:glutamine synthetase adenylyltransferase